MEIDKSSKPRIVQLQLSENVKRNYPERNLEITSDGKYLVQSGCWDNSFKFYHLGNGVVSHSIEGHSAVVTCMAFGEDGKTFATSSSDTSCSIWEYGDPPKSRFFSLLGSPSQSIVKRRQTLIGHDDQITCVSIQVKIRK